MKTINVGIVGATGETGSFITKALLESTDPKYTVTALARPSSVNKPAYEKLKTLGIEVVTADLNGPQDELVGKLSGIHTLVVSLPVASINDQLPLVKAAKLAGIKRYVPSAFAMVVPPRGVVDVQDMKQDIYDEIKALHLPYTIIDVGWWYSGFVPSLPSGRASYIMRPGRENEPNTIPGTGDVACVMTDQRDVGRYVARIIADPRTLNKMVLAYGESTTINSLYDRMEKLSGESAARQYIPAEALDSTITSIRQSISEGKDDYFTKLGLYWTQYQKSFGVRGDNTSEYAEYLGYILASDLYPDYKPISFETFFLEVLDGKARQPYGEQH